jgi:hypothetical protein
MDWVRNIGAALAPFAIALLPAVVAAVGSMIVRSAKSSSELYRAQLLTHIARDVARSVLSNNPNLSAAKLADQVTGELQRVVGLPTSSANVIARVASAAAADAVNQVAHAGALRALDSAATRIAKPESVTR